MLNFTNQCQSSLVVAELGEDCRIGVMNAHFNTLGKRVRILRNAKGWNQAKLVEELDKVGAQIGRTYISKLETSNVIPSGEVVKALADVLGTTADFLLLRIDDEEPFKPVEPVYFSEEADEIATIVDSLDPQRRILVQRLVMAVAEITLEVDEDAESQSAKSAVLDSVYAVLRNRYGSAEADRAMEELSALNPPPPMSALGTSRGSRRKRQLR